MGDTVARIKLSSKGVVYSGCGGKGWSTMVFLGKGMRVHKY